MWATKGGVKVDGLGQTPPVIDCSGWTALLLSTGMLAANRAAGSMLFTDADVAAIHTWSDRVIENLERRSGLILQGDRITLDALPRRATIGLQQGGGAWASNHPRPRGITHVVQVVRQPDNGSPHVSEAQGMREPRGLGLLPLAQWLDQTRDLLKPGAAWAVNAFAAPA